MKRSLLFLMACLIALTSSAKNISESHVPAAAKAAFNKDFPGVTNIKWEKEHGNYEANFKKDGKTMAATFNEKGEWLVTEEAIKTSELPAGITSYISKNYKGARIKEAALLKKAGDVKQYEAEVKGKDLIFDEKGNFIKEEKE